MIVISARMVAAQPGNAAPSGFADRPLPIEAVDGTAECSSLRGWIWTEPDGTRRVVLTDDVTLRLAGYDLTADRAAMWIADRSDLGDDHFQVFVYAEGIDTPTADAAVAVTADDLRIQGVIQLAAPIVLSADRVRPEPVVTGFTSRADTALAEVLATIPVPVPLSEVPALTSEAEPSPAMDQPPPAGPADRTDDAETERRATRGLEPRRDDRRPLLTPEGFITLAADRITRTLDGDQPAVVLSGGVHAAYSLPGERRVLELTSQRAVVFLNGSASESESGGIGGLNASGIDGIYLEGDVVASDEGYALRGPRMYYDIALDRALVLDAVFSTFDQSRGFPLYVRARSVRQVSRDEFVADRARLSNTAFARPNITLGARTLTITREQRAPAAQDSEPDRSIVDARGITLNAGTIPLAWLPRFRGDPERIPLREVSAVNVTDSGAEVRTRWDAITLLGLESRDDLGVDLLADALLDRGVGLGIEATWRPPGRRGGLLTYWVFEDSGTDVLSTGGRIERDGETRGIVRLEDRAQIDQFWTQRIEVSHVTDPAFTDAFYEELAETGREFQTRVHLTRRERNTHFTIEASAQIDDFTPNEYLLQTDAYSVQRLPEATYTRLADDVIPAMPGRLTYSSESRVGLLRFALNDATPAEYGFTSSARSQRAFGINRNQRFSDSLSAQGFNEDARFRFDTRHELVADLDAGPLQITPWVTGRLTAYDGDFSEFGPGTGDASRLHSVAGVTVSTTAQRVIDGAFSRALDVNRLRHLITPSVTFFNASTGVTQDELPVYDEEVESLAEGNALRLALEQTIQTKRGGPGRWYNVDLITLDTELVYASDESVNESSIGRFDPARPELSRLRDFAAVSTTYQATDAVAIVGGTIYDLDEESHSVSTAGILIDHHPDLRSSFRFRRLNDQDSTLVSASTAYDLEDKYQMLASVTYDTDEATVQSVNTELLRDFQSAVFGASVTYNNIREATSIGVIFQPLGQGSAARIGGRRTDADNRQSPLGG
ncbi:MAG: LPS assembly protein LptD [Planctomycetota bacterium]